MANGIIQSKHALYPWFIEDGIELVHPDDLQKFQKLFPYGKVFTVGNAVDDFVTLSYGSEEYRVKPILLEPVPDPVFGIGQHVICLNHGIPAVVISVKWHYKEERPYYFVTINGKRKSKRYWDVDLAAAPDPAS